MASRTQTSRIRWNGAPPRIVAGLISGTSADGIATVIARLTERGSSLRVQQLAFRNVPYPRGMGRTILSNSLPGTGRVDTLTGLHAAVGAVFAHALSETARRSRIPMRSIDLIGSHGQTIHHLPDPRTIHGITVRSTLQIGDPSVIAQMTGRPVVGDFRTADMAVGGQGAPLVPLLDVLLFRSHGVNRLLLNLGGIANFTAVPRTGSARQPIAFDTGPANMVIDALARELFDVPYDKDGRIARRGVIDKRLLRWMMSHRYLKIRPPKSTGRELFGKDFVKDVRKHGRGLSPETLLATATAFTAESVFHQYATFVHRRLPVGEVLVSGGGMHNGYLMHLLQEAFGTTPVRPIPEAGFSPDAKEALLCAVLAYRTVLGRTSNIPGISGARRPVILGKICLP